MPFCPNCGKEVGADVAFCPSCGFKLKDTQKSPSQATFQRKGRMLSEGGLNTKTYMLISTAGFGALALLSLLMGNSMGFILAAALSAALYFWGLKKLDMGDTETAKKTSLIVGVLGGVIGLAVLLSAGRSSFIGAIDILVAIPAFLAWHEMEKS
ncbi:MAG: zinc-ribbon domain-containing protein [Candidatus Aerophobetes bacterium]|nr:zinc-ribbon domain-containing protein [Candidatus Aerophobetes bacterium]